MQLTVLSVNIGKAQTVKAKSGDSGIFKTPQCQTVLINIHGLAGDVVCDLEHHGGVDQAVYIYCQDDYDWWHHHEGLATSAGLFGENLTLAGMASADAHVGARLISDNVILEITSPRIPCETLAARMNDKSFAKRFYQAARSGFYCRVAKPGPVSTGEIFQFQAYSGHRITMAEWLQSEPLKNLNAEMRQKFLSAPIHYKARAELQP
jgi:MOSC domain-containing protein YiiM